MYHSVQMFMQARVYFFNVNKKSVYVSFKTCNAYFNLLLNRHPETSTNTLQTPDHTHKHNLAERRLKVYVF